MKVKTFSSKSVPNLDEFPKEEWDSENTLVIAFGAPSFIDNSEPFSRMREHFGSSIFMGCSTSGEITGSSIVDESITGAVVRFDKTGLCSTTVPINKFVDSFEIGETIGKNLFSEKLRAVLVFSDGLNVNGSKLVEGLNFILPASVQVSGGLAGDGDRFENTWVLNNGIPESGYVTAVGFYGDHISFGHGSRGGWDIFGPERVVTKSVDNVIYEIDGNPALELYKNYLGELAAELPASALLFPLSVRESDSAEKRVVRTILKIDEETQSMTFAGNIPQGGMVQLMRANFDRLIDGASDAAEMTSEDCGDALLSIAISCVGRRLILGERAEEELEAVVDSLPEGVAQVGFYSYGEISPYHEGYCDLHNQTMTLTTISEK
ncbi:MAG: FIST N-terminal domain-containing protein [Pyrinomonadaceae bacterium]